jgi:CSLREA domain-containing protein
MTSVHRFGRAFLVACVLGLAGPVAAHAAIVVNTTADDSVAPSASLASCPATCTLRDALLAADNSGVASTIDLPAGHYRLTLPPNGPDNGTAGELQFTGGNVQIVGASAATTTIDATGLGDRVLELPNGGTLSLSHLTITGGSVAGSNGGGIDDDGTANLTLTDVAVLGNVSSQDGYGGGMSISSGSTVSIDDSLLADNENSGDGGAISTDGTLSITNSTLADNTVDTSLNPSALSWGAYGGAIYVGGGTIGLTNVTIAGNTIHGTNQTTPNGGSGTAIDNEASVTGVNVIIYGNTASGTAGPGDCNSSLTSDGHNVDQDGSCFSGGTGDTTANPKLGALASNGGDTQTMAISSTGSAYDAGSNAACPGTDQRGVKRPVAANCDIGAFELDPPVNTRVPAISGTLQPSQALSCSVGSWTGSPFQSYSYQWSRSGSAVAGATSSTYTVTSADVGHQLTCTVLASTPGDGSASATSAPSAISAATPVPAISGLRVSPHKLPIAGRKVGGRCVKPTKGNKSSQQCRLATKLKVSYTLNEAATVTFTVKREASGRKVGGKCVAQTHKNKHKSKCVRLIKVSGKMVKTGGAGSNHFVWKGRIGGHHLGPGTYKLTATPSGGKPQTVTFKIVS